MKKREEKNKNNKWIIIVFLLFISFFIISFVLYSINSLNKRTIFTFINNDTGENLNGEIFFDNYSVGYTQEGNISVQHLEVLPSSLRFIGEDKGEKFEIEYYFPKDYYSYRNVSFLVSNEELEFYKEYYLQKKQDSFPNVLEPHFKKIPITWKIQDKSQCWKTEEEKIRKAFSEIEKSSEGYIKFQEVYSNPDIYVLCFIDFTEQYNNYKEELEMKKICNKITFNTKKTSFTDSELNISYYFDEWDYQIYTEYKVSVRTILLSENQTILEVCKVQKSELAFDPEIIFNSDIKLSDYILGEGGITKVIGNIILKGEGKFFGDPKHIISCVSSFPLVEVHELLHVLGLSHISENYVMDDVLSPYKNCENQTKINEHYASCLKYIYSNGEKGECSKVNFMINFPIEKCPKGYVLGQDYECHEECGNGYYCLEDSSCQDGKCYGCQEGYYLSDDNLCYPKGVLGNLKFFFHSGQSPILLSVNSTQSPQSDYSNN